MARPSSYKAEYAKIAEKMCILGATDLDLAEAFDVTVRSIHNWKIKHKAFFHSLSAAKDGYDYRIERSLAMRAIGYSHPDTDIRVIDGKIVVTNTTKHYPPDTKAALAWLYNRKPDRWHPLPSVDIDNIAPPLDIHFHVKEAAAEIKVTNAKS